MGESLQSRPQCCGKKSVDAVNRSEFHTGVVRFLRARHPRATAVEVEVETGISRRTVERWLEDVATGPSSWHLLTLIAVYGPNFLTAALGPAAPWWLAAARREERLAEIEEAQARLAAEHAALVGEP